MPIAPSTIWAAKPITTNSRRSDITDPVPRAPRHGQDIVPSVHRKGRGRSTSTTDAADQRFLYLFTPAGRTIKRHLSGVGQDLCFSPSRPGKDNPHAYPSRFQQSSSLGGRGRCSHGAPSLKQADLTFSARGYVPLLLQYPN